VSEPLRVAVIGAAGTIGQAAVEEFAQQGHEVTAVARRQSIWPEGTVYQEADLWDVDATTQAFRDLGDHDTVVFAAYQDGPDIGGIVGPNVELLGNALDAARAADWPVRHVTLYQGGKYYGAHIGPFKTPAKESDPRLPGPNFYYAQQDLLEQRAAADGFNFSIFRPEAVCGIAPGNPLNLLLVIAVYAAICKELGMPMRFPGTRGNYEALYQVTDAGLLGRATVWGATSEGARDEAFNIANGDHFRWMYLWPELAKMLDVEPGPQHHLKLALHMADYESVWAGIVAKYDLRPTPFDMIVNFAFGDFIWGNSYDNVFSMVKLRQAGFSEHMDTEVMFSHLFARLRRERLIP
jgi:nucleoside-diphosphate-sugar epimerase